MHKLKDDWFEYRFTSLLLALEGHRQSRVWLRIIGRIMNTLSRPVVSNRPLKSLLSMSEVQQLIGNKSRSTIYRWIAAGSFPAPIKVYSSSLWPEEEIAEWRQQIINGQ